MCILIFAFRGCYYLVHLHCKICFSLRVFAFEGLNTKLSVNVFLAWYIVTPGPLWLKLLASSRLSNYLSLYVFLLRRRSFAAWKVYISLETLLCLSQLSDRTCFSSSMYRFIPPFGRSATTFIYRSPPCVSGIHRKRNYGFTRSTRPITAHERTAICKSQLEAFTKKPGNTRGVGTTFWSLIIPGFSFVCNAGYRRSCSPKFAQLPVSHFTLLFCRGQHWNVQRLITHRCTVRHDSLSYFDHQQNFLEIEENLKIILYKDGKTPKRYQ